MSIITFYQEKLDAVRLEKVKVNAQITALREKLNTHSANSKLWMDWWQGKSDLSNRLCDLVGTEKTYEQKIASLE